LKENIIMTTSLRQKHHIYHQLIVFQKDSYAASFFIAKYKNIDEEYGMYITF